MIRRYVESKARWSDPWVFEQYIAPVACAHTSAPSIGDADLHYDFGRIKREDRSAYADYVDRRLNDRYVRISIQRPSQPPTPLWTGIVADTQTTPVSADVEGSQSFKAWELTHLLDRVELRTSNVQPTMAPDSADEDVDGETVRIDRVVTFNERSEGFGIDGNRSLAPSADNDAAYYFSPESSLLTWSAYDVVQYLLWWHAPREIPWQLTGQTDPLLQSVEVWDLEGLTVWQALSQLIRRDRGLGFYLRIGPGDTDQAVELVVYSISERSYRYGASELPANDNPVFFQLPGGPAGHLLADVPFRNTAVTQYDRIEIVAERMLAAATYSIHDGTLEPAWTSEQEQLYKAAVGEDEEENDQYRAAEYFAPVYAQYRVPRNWDGRCGAGYDTADDGLAATDSGAEDLAVTIPKRLDDGEFDTQTPGQLFNAFVSFERELPMQQGLDYLQSSIPPSPEGAVPEYAPLLVAVKWRGWEDGDDTRWAAVDRLTELDEDLLSGNARPLDGELGVEIVFAPRHALARNRWEDAAPSNFVPDEDGGFDYHDMLVTAVVETDRRPRIVLDRAGGQSAEVPKTLRIEVSGAEYWYVNPQTIVDVDHTGQPVRYLGGAAEGDLCFIRKDSLKLQAVASFAVAWYGPRRQPIVLPIKELGSFVPLGCLLTDVRGAYWSEPVRTPVTAKRWDFVQGMTLIETGYAELDHTALMDDYWNTWAAKGHVLAEQLVNRAAS